MINLLLNFISWCLSKLGYTGIRFCAICLGVFAFDILKIRRDVIINNLNIVYKDGLSPKEKIKIGRASAINFFTTVFEFIAAKHLFPKATVEFENKQIVLDTLQREMGLYALCIHMGNWEYLCHAFSVNFSEVFVVAKDLLKGQAEIWVKNNRRAIGFSLIDRKGKNNATKQIFNAIDNKKVVGFIVDQKRPNGQMLPFFGQQASTNDSLAKLSFKKEAPIVPVIIKRTKPGHFVIKFYPEFIYNKNTGLTLEENIKLFTLQMNRQVEEMILDNPQEYYWFHNRWNMQRA